MRWIIIGILCNCSYNIEPIYIDSRFTDSEKSVIASVHAEWIEATDTHGHGADIPLIWNYDVGQPFRQEDFYPGRGGDIDILFKGSMNDPGYLSLKESLGNDFEGITNTHAPLQNRVMVIVTDRIEQAPNPEETFRVVLLHEFGHWHGISWHTETGLMSPTADADCIDPFTLEVYCDRISCGSHAKTSCK